MATSPFPRAVLFLAASVLLVLLAGCTEPEVVASTAQRAGDAGADVSDPVTEVTSDESATAGDESATAGDESATTDPDTTEPDITEPEITEPETTEPDSEAQPTPPEATPTPLPEPETNGSVPADFCSESADAIISDFIAWTDTGLDRSIAAGSIEYTDSAGDPLQSFVNGTLSCSAQFDDGSSLSLAAYSNYNTNSYGGTRTSGTKAGFIPILIAATPTTMRAIVEYPLALSSTGLAAVEITFDDPEGLDAGELQAVEDLAATIRDEVAFSPPEGGGPSYPDWYDCGLNIFGTSRGDTAALADALDQNLGLHAEETIDRNIGSIRCSLYEGPGTVASGGFAVGEVFVALAAYEAGSATFGDTVSQVLSTPGVEEGTLDVGGVAYRTVAGEGSLAVILSNGGNGVISVFDPVGETSAAELEAVMIPILTQLFAS